MSDIQDPVSGTAQSGQTRRWFLGGTLAVASGSLFTTTTCRAAEYKKEQTAEKWPLGVCASIDAGVGVKLEVAREVGVPTIQLYAPRKATRTKEQAAQIMARLKEWGIRINVVIGRFDGENYSEIATIARTAGLVPRATRPDRLKEMKEVSQFARLLGVGALSLHLGFLPHHETDPLYAEVVAATRQLCSYCKANGQNLHLETGQEPADILVRFLGAVGRDNLFVNFDPANMIVYGTGEPIDALRKVGRWVRSVHCKDAKWAARPGQEWGRQVPLGEGDVGIEKFLRTLDEIGYAGPLTIEREGAQDPLHQKEDVRSAMRLLNELKSKFFAG